MQDRTEVPGQFTCKPGQFCKCWLTLPVHSMTTKFVPPASEDNLQRITGFSHLYVPAMGLNLMCLRAIFGFFLKFFLSPNWKKPPTESSQGEFLASCFRGSGKYLHTILIENYWASSTLTCQAGKLCQRIAMPNLFTSVLQKYIGINKSELLR